MATGRPPVPHDIKLLSNPAGRKVKDRSAAAREHGGGGGEVPNAGPLKGEVPDLPTTIPARSLGGRYWKLYWTAAGNWLAKADLPEVERLCRLHNTAEALWKAMQEEGVAYKDEDGKPRVSRYLMDWQRVLGQMERIEDRLGLNPVERSRIRIQVKEHESALDRWRGDRTGT